MLVFVGDVLVVALHESVHGIVWSGVGSFTASVTEKLREFVSFPRVSVGASGPIWSQTPKGQKSKNSQGVLYLRDFLTTLLALLVLSPLLLGQ